MGVSKNRGTPKSSILIGFSIINHQGFSIINHPFCGYPYFWKQPYGKTFFLSEKDPNLWVFFRNSKSFKPVEVGPIFFMDPQPGTKKHGIPPWVSGYRKWCGFKPPYFGPKSQPSVFFMKISEFPSVFLFPLLNASQNIHSKKTAPWAQCASIFEIARIFVSFNGGLEDEFLVFGGFFTT